MNREQKVLAFELSRRIQKVFTSIIITDHYPEYYPLLPRNSQVIAGRWVVNKIILQVVKTGAVGYRLRPLRLELAVLVSQKYLNE